MFHLLVTLCCPVEMVPVQAKMAGPAIDAQEEALVTQPVTFHGLQYCMTFAPTTQSGYSSNTAFCPPSMKLRARVGGCYGWDVGCTPPLCASVHPSPLEAAPSGLLLEIGSSSARFPHFVPWPPSPPSSLALAARNPPVMSLLGSPGRFVGQQLPHLLRVSFIAALPSIALSGGHVMMQ